MLQQVITVLKANKAAVAVVGLLLVAALAGLAVRGFGAKATPAQPEGTAARAAATATTAPTRTGAAAAARTATPALTPTATATPTSTPTLTPTPTPTNTRVPVAITADNANTLQPIDRLAAGAANVQSVSLSRDTRTYAFGLADGTLQLWRVGTTAPVLSLAFPGNMDPRKSYSVVSAALSPDGASIAGGYADNRMRLWRFAELGKVIEGGHGGPVWAVAYSNDGKLIASGAEDKNVQIRQATDGGRANAMGGHTGPVRSLAFSPDGTLLASGSDDRSVILWRTGDRKLQRRLPGHPEPVTALAFAPGGQTLATGSDTVRLWKMGDPGLPLVLERPADLQGAIKGLAYSADGQVLAAYGRGGYVALWDTRDGRMLGGFTCQACGAGQLEAMTFAADGMTLAVASGSAIVWYAAQ